MPVYSPSALGITVPKNLSGNGNWIQGRQIWNGTLSDVGTIHPESNQIGAGQAVSPEVNAQSAAAQGVTTQKFNSYLDVQRNTQKTAGVTGTPMTAGVPADSSGSAGASGSFSAPSTINLQSVYDKAYQEAGITELEAQLAEKNKALIEATGMINENPYYREATRTGRIAKLEEQANKDIALLQSQIQSKKADVDTKLGIATKQFDINTAASNQALNQFNTLLSAGALDSASGSDIAQFGAATGLPTSFIQSAINLNKQKNTESKLIESTDDSGNVTVSLVQIKDGQLQVVGKQSLGKIGNAQNGTVNQSAVKSAAISTATQILDAQKNSYGHVGADFWREVRSAAMQSGLTADDFNKNFSAYTDPYNPNFAADYGFDVKQRGASQYQVMNQN